MSKILEEKIKAIMGGASTLAEDKKAGSLANTKEGKQEEQGAGGEATKAAADKDNKVVDKGEPKVGEGKKNSAEVKESAVPEIGKDLSGVGKQTSAGEDNTKIDAGKNRGLGEKGKVSQPASADSKDDNGDNQRGDLKPGAAEQEKGGKLKAESFTALFDGEELTEEFTTKAEAIFEAALIERTNAIKEQLEAEYQSQISEAIGEVKGELVEQIDGYLDFVVEQWMQDNAVALESGMKVELVDSFINGIKNVFAEHYVEVPSEKTDVVAEQAKEIEELKAAIAGLTEEKEQAVNEAKILRCEDIISEAATGLTAIQNEKFRALVSEITFDTEEEFATKVKTIRESMFAKSQNGDSQEVAKPAAVQEEKSSIANAVLSALQKGDLKFVRQV